MTLFFPIKISKNLPEPSPMEGNKATRHVAAKAGPAPPIMPKFTGVMIEYVNLLSG